MPAEFNEKVGSPKISATAGPRFPRLTSPFLLILKFIQFCQIKSVFFTDDVIALFYHFFFNR